MTSSINERIKWIFDQEGVEYGRFTDNEEELVRRFQVAMQLRAKRLALNSQAPNARGAKPPSGIAVCLVVSGTRDFLRHRCIIGDLVSDARNSPSRNNLEKIDLAAIIYCNSGDLRLVDFNNKRLEEILEAVDVNCRRNQEEHSDLHMELQALSNAPNLRWPGSEIASSRVIVHFRAPSDPRLRDDPSTHKVVLENTIRMINDSKLSYLYCDPDNRTPQDEVTTFLRKNLLLSEPLEYKEKFRLSRILMLKASEDRAKAAKQRERYGVPNCTTVPVQAIGDTPPWKELTPFDAKCYFVEEPASLQEVIDGSDIIRRPPVSVLIKKADSPYSTKEIIANYHGQMKVREESAKTPREHEWVDVTIIEYTLQDERHTFQQKFVLTNHCNVLQVATFMLREFCMARKIAKRVESVHTGVLIPSAGNIRPMLIDPVKLVEREGNALQKVSQFYLFTPEGKEATGRCLGPNSPNRSAHVPSGHSEHGGKEMKSLGGGIRNSRRYRVCGKEFDEMLRAFSHWTFDRTQGFMTISILECLASENSTFPCNKGQIMCDELLVRLARIHCKDTTRYLPWNQGEQGMRKVLG